MIELVNEEVINLNKLMNFMATNKYKVMTSKMHKNGILEIVFYNGSNLSKNFVRYDSLLQLDKIK